MEKKTFIVDLEPVGRRAEIQSDQSILEAAQTAGVELVSLCGGIGACDSCRIRLVAGLLTPLSLEEKAVFSKDELEAGFRLACQAYPLSDVKIDIPPDSLTTPQRLQVEGRAVEVSLRPCVFWLDVDLPVPSLGDLRSDHSRLKDALLEMGEERPFSMAHEVMKEFSNCLRSLNWQARLVFREEDACRLDSGAHARGIELIAVLPPQSRVIGLAVDIGTTKMAAYLMDLASGETIAKTGTMNPQISYGEDVISRISYVNQHPEEGRAVLQARVAETLNNLVAEMCEEAGVHREQIVEAVVVGNTAMHHLFTGLPVSQLGTSPYVPSISDALDIPAVLLGLRLAPGAYVHLPPNIAGYVGADHVSMVLASEVWRKTETLLALDIGTNTEITLSVGKTGQKLCCSCASGPAFEGAHIHDGMRAAPGAIERVQISDNQIRLYTIGDQPPVGICGSGILDAVAEMLRAGLLDHRGVLRKDHPFVRAENNLREFILATAEASGHGREVIVNRQDVNEIQLAKGAIRTGIEILLAEAGISWRDLDGVIVAGAFGTYINIESAIRIGMLPPLPVEKYVQVGNAAGAGARQMVVSVEQRLLAQELARQETYIELSTHPDFTKVFSRALLFPENMEGG